MTGALVVCRLCGDRNIFGGGAEGGGGGGHTVRCLWYPLPHWLCGLFIISLFHVCFLLFLSSWALQSPASRNSLFQALLLPVCLYIVVLVYNPALLPLFLVNILFLGSAEPSLSEMLLCTLLSYRCCSLLLQGTPSSQAVHVTSSLPSQYYGCSENRSTCC